LKAVQPDDYVPNGKTRIKFRGANGKDVHASPICIGAWSWGDKATWHWDEAKENPGLHEAWDVLMKNGINFIDTAQVYGSGRSEEICGDLIHKYPRNETVIQTKYWVDPVSITNILSPSHAPIKKLKISLERMKLDYVDIYLVHGPIHPGSIKQIAKGMAECVEAGLTKCVGVANYDEKDMIEMYDALKEHGVPLAVNQCEYHPLRRLPETSGLLEACKARDIVFQSYSSLAQGRLSGKWNKDNEPPKTYRFSSYPMKDIEPVLEVLRTIAERRNVPISAVTLNYNLSKGVVPVVGVRNVQQAEQNSQALGWRLTREEIQNIDAVSFEGKSTSLWQQG
jgi:aryl-alcohol dehydrogenase-like predicted oxidoreductase